MQAFLAEAQAILRAHVLAIGGNALVSYQLNEIVLLDNPHKHQVSQTQAPSPYNYAFRNEAFLYQNLIKSFAYTLLFLQHFPCPH